MYKLSRLKNYLKLYLVLVALVIISCDPDSNIPEKFKNATVVSDSAYTIDSLFFSDHIKSMIKKGEGAFFADSYNSKTSEVYIDSIIYSPDLTKAAFFVIVKNSNNSLLVSDNPEGFHYNAKCFLAQRDSTANNWSLKWFRIMNMNRYSKYDEISNQVRKRYFEDLKKIDNEDGNSRYKYNLDDVRFWSSPAWSDSAQMLERNYSGDGGK